MSRTIAMKKQKEQVDYLKRCEKTLPEEICKIEYGQVDLAYEKQNPWDPPPWVPPQPAPEPKPERQPDRQPVRPQRPMSPRVIAVRLLTRVWWYLRLPARSSFTKDS